MKGKKSFIAYADWKEMFEELPDEEAGKLVKHIFRYVNDEEPETDSILVRALFTQIRATLKRDLKKWEEQRQQRVDAGKASAAKRKQNSTTVNDRSTKHNERARNSTVNVSVSDSVSENVNVNEREENARALDYLKENFPTRFESEFLMRYKSQINNRKKFAEDFNDTVDQEQLPYSDRVLFARLGKYARNWIDNQDRYNSPQKQVQDFYSNIPNDTD